MQSFKTLTINIISFILLISWTQAPKMVHVYDIKEVLKDKHKFHNRTIKIRGCFMERFEERALYSKCTIERRSKESIWILFNAESRRKYNFDSLSRRIITVQGVLDTTKKGHCSAYPCSLYNAFIVELD